MLNERAVHPPEPAREPRDTPLGNTHCTGVVEKGSFALASCSCGWKGPARRARERARRDAAEHAGRPPTPAAGLKSPYEGLW